GSWRDLSFTVQNTGTRTLTANASTSAPYTIASGASFSLGPGASQAVVVRFSPTVTGTAPGTVAFTSNGGNLSRPVTGTGSTLPMTAATPSSLSFCTVTVGTSTDLTFLV